MGTLEGEGPSPTEESPTMVDSSTTSPTTEEESMEANPEDVVDGTPLQPPTVEGVLKVVVGGGTGGGQVVVGGGNSGGGTGGGTGGG
ncbi:MAG: hypothetical protein ABSA11_16160, partial [Candidatus Bathyarchaeia archaeon]